MSEVAVALPAPELTISGVEQEPHAAVPLLRFTGEVTDPSGREIYTIALSAQIHLDADRRAYSPDTRERLVDLFGEPERLPQTVGSMFLARVDTLVPSFQGTGPFALTVPFSGDVEIATTRYLASLRDGGIPITFHLNGSILYRGEADRLQVTLVPWSTTAKYRLPVTTWRELMERRYAGSGFVRLQADTLEALRRRRTELGLPTLDATIAEALR
jgi:hypothetical protein